jgi:hypothetical protein
MNESLVTDTVPTHLYCTRQLVGFVLNFVREEQASEAISDQESFPPFANPYSNC